MSIDTSAIFSDLGEGLGTLTFNLLLQALVIFLIGLACVRLLLKLFDRAISRTASLSPLRDYLRPVLRIVLYAMLALVVLGSLGVEVTSFVALLSIAGLAVSLALQNTLSNVAGGLMILLSKPFTVGDYVSCDGIEGTVHFIGLSYTTLSTPDNKEIFVPNSQISGAKIINYNGLGTRRLDLRFNVSYDAPTEAVKAAITEAMERFPQILPDPAPAINISAYNDSSITFFARLWVKAEDYWTVNFGMLETVRETFRKHGVEMTYNHLNVHIKND